MGIMQRHVVERGQVEFSKAGDRRSTEREGILFRGSLRKEGNREVIPFRESMIYFEKALVAIERVLGRTEVGGPSGIRQRGDTHNGLSGRYTVCQNEGALGIRENCA